MCAAGGIGVCQGSVKCVGYLLLIGSQASAVVEKRLRKKYSPLPFLLIVASSAISYFTLATVWVKIVIR